MSTDVSFFGSAEDFKGKEASAKQLHQTPLAEYLWQTPFLYYYRFDAAAHKAILEQCYQSLWQHDPSIMQQYFFPTPQELDKALDQTVHRNKHNVSKATRTQLHGNNRITSKNLARQKGRLCGRLFRKGELVYRCRHCGVDDTCVLCSECFHATNHDGHDVLFSMSPGSGGCCDCADPEAWKVPLQCEIHTECCSSEDEKSLPSLPEDIVESIRSTVQTVLDYILDVFTLAPEDVSLPSSTDELLKSVQQTRSYINSVGIRERPTMEDENDVNMANTVQDALMLDSINEAKEEYVCIAWNDESHAFSHVLECIASATGCDYEQAKEIVDSIHAYGRAVISRSRNIDHLRKIATPLAAIHLGVTIRPARDIYREDVCVVLLKWLNELSHGQTRFFVDFEHGDDVFRRIIAQEICAKWAARLIPAGIQNEQRNGSNAALFDSMESELTPTSFIAGIAAGTTESSDVMDATMTTTTSGNQRSKCSTPVLQDVGDIDWNPAAVMRQFGAIRQEEMELTDKLLGGNREAGGAISQWKKAKVSAEEIQSKFLEKVRLDYLMLYDFKFWKEIRILMRELYISTLASNKDCKRFLGERLARNYTRLAEFFLLKDREAESSIILFSVQLLTVPSVADLLVNEYDFFAVVCSALATFFLTDHLYLIPPSAKEQLNIRVNCESRAFRVRRYFNAFHDLRYMMNVDMIKPILAQDPLYLRQFLDMIALFQCMNAQICQKDTHVEYESEMWVNAFNVTLQIAKCCRQFSDCFSRLFTSSNEDRIASARILLSAISRTLLKIYEWDPSSCGMREIKDDSRQQRPNTQQPGIPGPSLQVYHTVQLSNSHQLISIVKYDITSEPVSFHHPLHWLLAGLLEQAALLDDTVLAELGCADNILQTIIRSGSPDISPSDILLSIVDFSIRTIAFSAQVRAGVWVRNGYGIRNQAHHYRDISLRENTFDADIFLLQTAFALADVDKLLLTLLDRFSLLGWFFGGEKEHPQYDASQTIFMIEELLNLLIICACDRSNCTGVSIQDKIRKEIIHNLCLGPLTYSELLKRIPERMHEHADFDSILAAVGDFRAPTGVNDFGSYILKQHLYSEVDPYFWHYSRNSREEALATLKARWKKDNPGKPDKEFFILPKTSRIGIGPFKFVGSFLQSPIFTKMLSQVFWSARCPGSLKSDTILDQALQLVMIGLLDGNYRAGDADKGFAFQACFQANRFPNMETDATMLDLLSMLRDDDAFNEIHAQLEWIFTKLEEYDNVHTHQKMHEWKQQRQLKMQRTPSEASISDQEAKKRAAIERQKKIMAQFAQAQSQFMEQNEDLYDEEDLEDAESKVSENLLSPVVAEGSNYEISRLYSYPVGTCIVCQEDVNQKSEPYGLLGFIQTSNILREVPDLGDKATLEEICNIYCKGLDTEWPDQHILPDEETSVPVFQTELHKSGFYSSTCGHLMHIKCFNNYCASIDSRHSSQLTRNHPEDRSRKEFMCPLCKSIGNTLLPIFWKGRKEAFPGIIAAHDTPNYYAFLQKGVQSGIDRLVNAIVHYRANAAQRRWSGGANKLKEAVATWMPTLRTSSSSTISFDSSLSSTANSSATHDFLTSFSHSHATPTAQTDHSSSSDRQLPPLRVGCGRSMGGSHMESRFGPFDTNVLYPTAVENLTLISNVYTQLFEVLSAIHEEICSYEPTRDMSTGVKNIDLLWCMLGYTIVAIEISIRGNKLPTELPERVEHTGSLFDQIPQQMQMLLRILSDTVLAYTFVMSQQDQNSSSGLSGSSTGGVGAQIATRVHLLALGRLRQVFVDAQVGDFANVQGLGYDRVVVHENPTLLQDDPFMILAELTLHGIPYAKLNVHALLRVLLLAELTKTTVALVQEQLKRIRSGELPIRQVELEECEALEDDELAAVRRLVFFVMDSLQIPDNEAVTIFDAIGQEKFRRLLRSFALPYLRRGLILMIVRYGYIPRRKAHQGQQEDEQVMMDSYVEEENEFDRLLDLLWLPNLSEIVQLEPENEHLIQGWCRHHLKESDHAMQLQEAHGVMSSPCTRLQDIPLDLPTPLRLVPLPRQLDTLIDESMKRVCDKCGTVPSDPALCLLCGTFVCAQSFCCAEDEQGECNLHRINCGGEVGIFLWVKRCVLILLHNNNGWFINAPYLDTHGEVDQGLRRGKPQYLNVKRYSEIRKLWLQHSIPNYVARQIEANYDIGGWTTL